ncbi:ATP-binding cassette domain-containing protein [Proteus mirabilis]
MASVNLNNLYKTFDGSKYVVNGIDINIVDGAFLVIVGPSGCGKSTTLNFCTSYTFLIYSNWCFPKNNIIYKSELVIFINLMNKYF